MIKINLDLAKDIVHNKRRIVRQSKLKPLDVEVTIPHLSEQAELNRQAIRDEDAIIQAEVDKATTELQLRVILEKLESE
jgi:hypothetical protein